MRRNVSLAPTFLLLFLSLAACQSAQPTATPEPSVTIDTTGTAQARFNATTNARWTAAAQSSTATAALTPIVTATVDNGTLESISDPPYLQSGGAVPSNALARIGIGQIFEAKVYPDQSRVLFRTGSGLYVYRLPEFQLVWRRYLDHPAREIVLSKTGRFVSIDYGGNAPPLLLDAESGERIIEFQESWFGPTFSVDDQTVAIETFSSPTMYRLKLFDTSTGKELRTLETPASRTANATVFNITWSQDNQYVAACSDLSISIWNTLTGERIHTITKSLLRGGFSGYGCWVRFSPDAQYLIGKDETHAFVINTASGQPVYEGAKSVRSITLSGTGIVVISDDRLTAFKMGTWDTVFNLDIPIWNSSESPLTHQIALASGNGITVIDSDSLETQYVISLPAGNISWSPGGQWLVGQQQQSSNGQSARATLFDGKTGQIVFDPFDIGDGIAFVDEQRLR